MSSPSSWSWNGEPLPFVPYVSNEEKESMGFTNRHAASLTNKVAVEKALIGVENIDGPILLLSGGMDASWPATEMGPAICSVVNASNSEKSCTLLTYAEGDHLLTGYESETLDAVAEFLQSVSE